MKSGKKWCGKAVASLERNGSSNCVRRPLIVSGDKKVKLLIERLRPLLKKEGVELSAEKLQRLARHLRSSIRARQQAHARWSQGFQANDILHLIGKARNSGNLDESFWRAFLAAHFGRESADENNTSQVESAAQLLFGFTTRPMWTWSKVRRDPERLRRWLLKNVDKLQRLPYGNHRKHESQKPHILWKVIKSFRDLADEHGGRPSAIFDVEGIGDAEERFDVLYTRLRGLHRFGRLGRFDLLSLLADAGLIDAVPGKCYLRGATGPRNGALLLWGSKPDAELDKLAADLCRNLSVSPFAVEDALCNWQKDLPL